MVTVLGWAGSGMVVIFDSCVLCYFVLLCTDPIDPFMLRVEQI